MELGTRVKVKSDLKLNGFYGEAMFTSDMEEFLGKEMIVTEILSKSSYELDNIKSWEFTDEMLDYIQ